MASIATAQIAAAGPALGMRLAALDSRVLAAIRAFGHERLNNVAAEAISKIGQQLGLGIAYAARATLES